MLFGTPEVASVLLLQLAPGWRRGNSVGFFNAYERSKSDPEVPAWVGYLVHWAAGTKLIFIVLLVGILTTGNAATKVFAGIALIFSIMTFFWRLYPALKKVERKRSEQALIKAVQEAFINGVSTRKNDRLAKSLGGVSGAVGGGDVRDDPHERTWW